MCYGPCVAVYILGFYLPHHLVSTLTSCAMDPLICSCIYLIFVSPHYLSSTLNSYAMGPMKLRIHFRFLCPHHLSSTLKSYANTPMLYGFLLPHHLTSELLHVQKSFCYTSLVIIYSSPHIHTLPHVQVKVKYPFYVGSFLCLILLSSRFLTYLMCKYPYVGSNVYLIF